MIAKSAQFQLTFRDKGYKRPVLPTGFHEILTEIRYYFSMQNTIVQTVIYIGNVSCLFRVRSGINRTPK